MPEHGRRKVVSQAFREGLSKYSEKEMLLLDYRGSGVPTKKLGTKANTQMRIDY